MKPFKYLALSVGVLCASESMALIDGQILFGSRRSEGDSSGENSFDGTTTKLSLYAEPLPLIPVAAGLTYAYTNYDPRAPLSKLTLSEYSVDVTAWLPLEITSLKPYAKIGYVFHVEAEGSGTVGVENVSLSREGSGMRYAVGIKYAPIPLLAGMLEYEIVDIDYNESGGEAGTAICFGLSLSV